MRTPLNLRCSKCAVAIEMSRGILTKCSTATEARTPMITISLTEHGGVRYDGETDECYHKLCLYVEFMLLIRGRTIITNIRYKYILCR